MSETQRWGKFAEKLEGMAANHRQVAVQATTAGDLDAALDLELRAQTLDAIALAARETAAATDWSK